MLTLEQLNKLRGISPNDQQPPKPVSSIEENKKQNINDGLGIDGNILNTINPKWRKLLEANKDVDMSKYINTETKYDDFGMPIIDFDMKNSDELPKISEFGITE